DEPGPGEVEGRRGPVLVEVLGCERAEIAGVLGHHLLVSLGRDRRQRADDLGLLEPAGAILRVLREGRRGKPCQQQWQYEMPQDPLPTDLFDFGKVNPVSCGCQPNSFSSSHSSITRATSSLLVSSCIAWPLPWTPRSSSRTCSTRAPAWPRKSTT